MNVRVVENFQDHPPSAGVAAVAIASDALDSQELAALATLPAPARTDDPSMDIVPAPHVPRLSPAVPLRSPDAPGPYTRAKIACHGNISTLPEL